MKPSVPGVLGGVLSMAQAVALWVLLGPVLWDIGMLLSEAVPDVLNGLGESSPCVIGWVFLGVVLLVVFVVALLVLVFLVMVSAALALAALPAWWGQPAGQAIAGATNLGFTVLVAVVLASRTTPLGWYELAYPLVPVLASALLFVGAWRSSIAATQPGS